MRVVRGVAAARVRVKLRVRRCGPSALLPLVDAAMRREALETSCSLDCISACQYETMQGKESTAELREKQFHCFPRYEVMYLS